MSSALPAIRRCCLAAVVVTGIPVRAYAHAGEPIAPHDLWRSWTLAPAVLLGLAVMGACYAVGARAVWRRAGALRGVRRTHVAAFAGALATLLIALVSPLDALGGALFSAHMVQHMLLVVVAAPLLVLARPHYAMLFALPQPRRRALVRWWQGAHALRAVWSFLSMPGIAWLLHVGTLWLWHVPALYERALRDGRIHVAEHASFFLAASLFWWVVLDPHRVRVGAATLLLFTAGLQCTLLGALLALARHPWYAGHYGTTAAWGFTPLQDQQLAGMIMWIPAGLAYLIALLPRLASTLQSRTPLARTQALSPH